MDVRVTNKTVMLQRRNDMANLTQHSKESSIAKSFVRNPFLSLQTELDKAMRDFYTFLDVPIFSSNDLNNFKLTPSINIVEDDKNFKIEAEMPGMGEEDIKVSISDGIVNLRGEKKISRKNEGKDYRMQEIGYGCYERDIALPEDLDTDKAKATFRKGMLWINFPKKQGIEKKSKELKIEKT